MPLPMTPIPARVADLRGDVAQNAPANRQALVYVAATAKWTPQALAQADIAGLAGDLAAAVKITTDQTIAGVKTLGDTLVHDLVANASGIATQIRPAATSVDDDVLWCDGLSSNPNGDGSFNPVRSVGFNTDFNSAPLDPAYPSFRDGWEYRWKNGSVFQSERHVGAMFFPGDPTEYRPITFSTAWATKTTAMTFCAESVGVLDSAGVKQLSSLTWDGSGSLSQTYTVDGETGVLWTITPAGDTFGAGRGTVPFIGNFNGTTVGVALNGDTTGWTFSVLTGTRDLEIQRTGIGTVWSLLGTAGSVGVLNMFAPAGQVNGIGFNLLTDAGPGAILQKANGSIFITPAAGATAVFLGGSNLTYIFNDTGVLHAPKVAVNLASAGAGAAQLEVKAPDAATNILAGYTSAGGAAAFLFRPNGAWAPPHLADSAAANDSVYYSTTASKLVYKDGAGVVNPLY